jgi:hypothetical protein
MFTIVIEDLLVKIPLPETTGMQKQNVKHQIHVTDKLSLIMKTTLHKNYLWYKYQFH